MQGLLHKSHPEKSARYSPEQAAEPEDDGCCLVNRWWKIVLFLLAWTIAIPMTVAWVHRGGKYGRETENANVQSPADTSGLDNRYVLDPSWAHDAEPQVREYEWTVTDTEYNPDGVYRPMMLINNQFPGPMVEVNEHDTLRITITNKAVNATSFHWHGLYQNGTNWMDGTVGITQCPIASGSSFTYEFKVAGQSGTYWYHAHQGVQSSDGLHGPLIIHAKNEREMQKIDYATDRVVMVSDHYHDLSGALAWQYLAPDAENAEPVPDGALINGRSIRNCDALPHRKCDNRTANVGIPNFDLAPGQNHRIRIINVGAFAEFQFQIDEHQLAVTEVDGTDVYPEYYHRLNINPAQRYSVVVNTSVATADTFWLRARMITLCFAEPNPDMVPDALGIVRYTPTASTKPTSIDWEEALSVECRDMNTTDLRPVQAVAAPKPDALFYLRSNFQIGDHRLSRGFFNTSTYRASPRSPSLFRFIDGLSTANASFAAPSAGNEFNAYANERGAAFVNTEAFDLSSEMVIQTEGIQVIDLLVHNFDDGNHPLHLHGYKFFVLAQGHGYPSRHTLWDPFTMHHIEPLYASLDLSNPLRRDTASVEAFGWVLLRVVADNPGAWAFHCHVSWHTEAGLMMQLLTRSDVVGQMEVPEAMREMCAAPGLESGMAPEMDDYKDIW